MARAACARDAPWPPDLGGTRLHRPRRCRSHPRAAAQGAAAERPDRGGARLRRPRLPRGVARAGEPVDPSRLPVAAEHERGAARRSAILVGDVAGGAQRQPAVAFDGTRFLVAWSVASSSLRAVYVHPNGALGAMPLTLS